MPAARQRKPRPPAPPSPAEAAYAALTPEQRAEADALAREWLADLLAHGERAGGTLGPGRGRPADPAPAKGA